jgi:hypothetical protein
VSQSAEPGGSTLGELLPLGAVPKAMAPAMPPELPSLADALSAAPAPQHRGGVTTVESIAEEDEAPKKVETLSDLRYNYPQVDMPGSGTVLVVERIFPKVDEATGRRVDGVLGRYCAYHLEFDLCDELSFGAHFGWGTYEVWVEFPSRQKRSLATGAALPTRSKDTVKVHVPQKTAHMTQQATPPVYPFQHPANAAANAQVALEQAKTEGAVTNKLVDHLLRAPTPAAVSSQDNNLAAELARTLKEQAMASENALNARLDAMVQQNQRLQDELMQAQRQASRPDHTSADLVTSLIHKGNVDVEEMRRRNQEEINRMRQDYEAQIDRLRRDAEDSLRRERGDFDRKFEQHMRDAEQRIMRADTLADDRHKQEREHNLRLLESDRKEHERAQRALQDTHERALAASRADRTAAEEMLKATHQVLLQAKDAEIARTMAELNTLRAKVDHLERIVNKPAQQVILESIKLAELVQSTGGEKEEKPSLMQQAGEFLQAAGPMLAPFAHQAAMRLGGGAMPAMPALPAQGAPPNGQPPPKQMPAPKPRRNRDGGQPVQPQGPGPVVTPPPQQAPQQAQPQGEIKVRGPQSLTNEQLAQFVPMIEANAHAQLHANPPAAPEAFAATVAAGVPPETLRAFVWWIDGRNLAKVLDHFTKGTRGWSEATNVGWVEAVWRELERLLPRAPAEGEAAPQGAPAEAPAETPPGV